MSNSEIGISESEIILSCKNDSKRILCSFQKGHFSLINCYFSCLKTFCICNFCYLSKILLHFFILPPF